MRRGVHLTSLVLGFLLAAPLPAFANDLPGPDGMLSVLMIIPVAILGLRFARAMRPERENRRRVLLGFALGISILASTLLANTPIVLLGMPLLLCYGLHRGGLAISSGQGARRFGIGVGVMLFTLLAIANWFVSFAYYSRTTRHGEFMAINAVRGIVRAEIDFQSSARSDTHKSGVAEFGTIEQLVQAGLLDDRFIKQNPSRGYRYVLVRSEDAARGEKEFFVYARPENYGDDSGISLLPGFSLWAAVRPPKLHARRTFAADERGVLRAADLGTSRAVTREEAQKWKEWRPGD